LIEDLITLAEKGQFRITILSGDVHIGCAGVIYDRKKRKQSNAAIINSLISSAVVNVPPPAAVVSVLELTGGEIEEVNHPSNEWSLRAGLYRFHHDPRKTRYIPGRNFLELLADSEKGILCRWYSEGQETQPYELYINRYLKAKLFDLKLLVDDLKFVTASLSNLVTLPVQNLIASLFGPAKK